MADVLKKFWVLEGLDGAGTTTQLKNLENYMVEKGMSVFRTAEPTIYESGLLIRRVLSGQFKVPQSTTAYLFAADRDNHLNNPEYGIRSHLAKGETVISDRYFFSSLAYQSIGFSFEEVQKLNSAFPYPELVLYVDTPVKDCIKTSNCRQVLKWLCLVTISIWKSRLSHQSQSKKVSVSLFVKAAEQSVQALSQRLSNNICSFNEI